MASFQEPTSVSRRRKKKDGQASERASERALLECSFISFKFSCLYCLGCRQVDLEEEDEEEEGFFLNLRLFSSLE